MRQLPSTVACSNQAVHPGPMPRGDMAKELRHWSVYCSLRALRAGASGGLVDLFEDYLESLVSLGVGSVTVGECEGAGIAERYSRRIRGLRSQFWTDDVLTSAREENSWLQRERPSHVLYPYPFYHNLYSRHSGVVDWCAWTRTIVCIPDLQHLVLPEYFTATERKDRDELFNEALERATSVFTISHTSSEAMFAAYISCCEQPPVVFPHGKGARGGESSKASHVLYPANDWRHKNHPVLLEAWSQLRAAGDCIPLVLTGARGKLSPPMNQRIRESNLEGIVEDRAYVQREELNELLRNARCLIFPSLFEGFGMPILEAMEKGIPVVCSRIPVFEEVAGEAAAYFAPDSVGELAMVVRDVWKDEARRERMTALGRARARRFTAERTGEALRAVLGGQVSGERTTRSLDRLNGWKLILPDGRNLLAGKYEQLGRIVGRWPGTDLFLLDAWVDKEGREEDRVRHWDDPEVYHSGQYVWVPDAGALVANRIAATGDETVAEMAMRIEARGGVVRVLKGRWGEGETNSLVAWRSAVEARWCWMGEGWAKRTAGWVWEALLCEHARKSPWVRVLYGLWSWLLQGGESRRAMARSLLLTLLPLLVTEGRDE